jgi:23S rRNA (pseudouridine1915-N3)-methyltransferase
MVRIRLLAVGTRMPVWIEQGFYEYTSRMPRECAVKLHEIPIAKRRKSSVPRLQIEQEGRHMLAAIPNNAVVVGLDLKGTLWSTAQLAHHLERWLQWGRELVFMIGGPDGLSEDCIKRADYRWSLSNLTFPHSLVRVMVAEQIYRAWTLIRSHPYHRD